MPGGPILDFEAIAAASASLRSRILDRYLEAYEALSRRYDTSPVTLRSRIFQLGALNDAYEKKLVQLRNALQDSVDRNEWAVLFAQSPAAVD